MTDPTPALTLADLESWSFDGAALAVLGQPIRHSISPAMHNAALAKMAQRDPQFAAWKYFRFEVPPAQLPEALRQLHQKNFRGINLTVPHKIMAVDHLAEIDSAARSMGAVNTLSWTKQGWHGSNTDGAGLAAAVLEDLGVTLAGTPIILIGSGGAARGAAVECLRRGCASLTIANRTAANLHTLLALLRPLAGAIPLRGLNPASASLADWPTGAIVINATSAGLKASDPVPVDLTRIDGVTGVYDMIYNPPRTSLLRAAESLGLPLANGLSMLVHQGARSLAKWTGAEVPVDVMRAAAQAALKA
jgi:shikimate dehydrogenase